jgi:hypothetical protein
VIELSEPFGNIIEHLCETLLDGVFPDRALVDKSEDVDCVGFERVPSEEID